MRQDSIKELLNCFDYIKHYQMDMLDSIAIMLGIICLKRHSQTLIEALIAKGNKRKPIYEEFADICRTILGERLYTPLNPHCNLLKILKVAYNVDTSNQTCEEFLHIITQKKTTHKLFSYSTPLEINELLVGLLDIQDNETVYNPCYGMGSLFFTITSHTQSLSLYGEELEDRLSRIAELICKILFVSSENLVVSNILKNAHFKDKKFDKIICNPPLDSYIGTQYLKEDERFATYEALIKTYPELLFLIHSLSHLKHKGVFILRNQTLQKSSSEVKLRERLYEEGLIECIIELPKNIFPHQNYDFSVIVLSPQNQAILHINANSPHFYQKDGKYNRLINLRSLFDIFHHKRITPYSSLTPLDQIDIHDLRVQRYVQEPCPQMKDSISLRDLGVKIFRGQRVYGSAKDTRITYFDLGIADFANYGFSEEFSTKRFKGEANKIQKYTLEPYDIALSIRGTTPKFTILAPSIKKHKVIANAGIVILRAPNPSVALGIYCYLFSQRGQKALSQIYELNPNSINPLDLEQLLIPNHFEQNAQQTFEQIQRYADELKTIKAKLQELRLESSAKAIP